LRPVSSSRAGRREGIQRGKKKKRGRKKGGAGEAGLADGMSAAKGVKDQSTKKNCGVVKKKTDTGGSGGGWRKKSRLQGREITGGGQWKSSIGN